MMSHSLVELHLLRCYDISGQREFQCSYRIPQAQFSDCGSFCFLLYAYPVFGVLMLHSTLLEYRQAERRKPTVWGHRTSYNGHLYEVGWRQKPSMVTLYRAYDLPDANGLLDSFNPSTTDSVAITAFPIHLANSKIHLLAGENGDDLVRVLFLPRKGPPEVKYLRVTLNQILAKLEESAIAGNAYRKRVRRSHRKERQAKSEEAAVSASEDRLGTEGSDADESSNVDSEEATNSVGGDDSESRDTD